MTDRAAPQQPSPGILVHDWIEPTGGSEKVVDEFAALFPGTPLFCLWTNDPGRFPDRETHESWVSRTPLRDRKALSLGVMSRTMRRAPTLGAGWALVSSHSFAHHFASDGQARRLPTCVYVHSPARYLWAPEVDPRGQSRLVRAAAGSFRRIDRKFAGTGAVYAVNSRYIARRAERAWGIDAAVIHPPIDVERLTGQRQDLGPDEWHRLESLPDSFVLGASRFVSYKQLDEVIRFGEACDLPVVLAGSGEDEARLRTVAAEASVPVHFFGRPSDGALASLYGRCIAYVFPPVEDFGMMPAEALACGAKVIVNRLGGAGEILDALGGGVTHDFRHGEARSALDHLLNERQVSPETVDHRLGRRRFRRQIHEWMQASLPVDLPPIRD